MRHLWAASSPTTVRSTLEYLNGGRKRPLAYTTVMTVMARLADKGVLDRHLEGRSYVYEAAVENVAELAVRRLLSEFGDAAVARFVAEAKSEPVLLRRLRDLLDANLSDAPSDRREAV